MRVLFLTTVLPGERVTGGEVVSGSFIDALVALGHDVRVVGYRRKGHTPPEDPNEVVADERHIETSDAGITAALWMARAVLTRRPYSVTKYRSRAYGRAVAELVAQEPPGLVIVDHAQIGWIERTRWPCPHVFLAHNDERHVHAELAARGGARGMLHAREARQIRRTERSLCRGAAAVWALTEGDAAAMRDLGAPPEIRVFDVPPTAVPPPAGEAQFDVAVLGSWTWSSNAEGLRWFLDHVTPRLPPGLDVHVGGAGADVLVRDHAVTVRGRVPDAMEFLQSGRVIAVPSVTGSGIQVKTLDAIASGRAVVATPIAMRGIEEPTPSVQVHERPEAFAAAVAEAVAAASTSQAPPGTDWARARTDRFREQVAQSIANVTRG